MYVNNKVNMWPILAKGRDIISAISEFIETNVETLGVYIAMLPLIWRMKG